MPRILCTLPNASNEISGIRFHDDHGHKLSDPVSGDVAARFAKIPGYEILSDKASIKPDDTGAGQGGTVNYADLKVGEIKALLAESAHLWERVLADETAANGESPRPGVVQAVEEAKQKLQTSE